MLCPFIEVEPMNSDVGPSTTAEDDGIGLSKVRLKAIALKFKSR